MASGAWGGPHGSPERALALRDRLHPVRGGGLDFDPFRHSPLLDGRGFEPGLLLLDVDEIAHSARLREARLEDFSRPPYRWAAKKNHNGAIVRPAGLNLVTAALIICWGYVRETCSNEEEQGQITMGNSLKSATFLIESQLADAAMGDPDALYQLG